MTNTAARGTDEVVLDSIRRLLADGQPLRRRPEAPPVPGNEKLLLTPALRVEPQAPQPQPAPVAWSLEERIAELEAAVGDAGGEWEPDGSEDPARERPSGLVFQHRPSPRKPDLVDEADLARPDRSEPEDGFDIFADDRLPDPDALRDLVAEIVRAELQSDLGQRVTRNIRKLVRREIRRALAARDFD